MDNDRRRGMSSCKEEFFNRIISRTSSIGCSSRIYYYRSSEGIPFNWEMQPGTPKEPRKEDTLPPLSPPPAVLSLGLPKPRIDVADEPKPSKLRVFKFWKHGKRKHGKSKKLDQADHKYCSSYETSSSDDGEFVVSPRRILSSSSSSSSFSFSNGSPSPSRDGHYGCSPLHFSSFGVGVSRLRLR
ncbi:hypothetical protein HRI_005228300 [Hibiscus trionum]|uniref:Uncharacterized protein n=1 Tax=Hibiscus trionum TaxID=183268 RepID=A0A9W7JHC8_HIBTR|nr:hypothetical protein HRI_005228300 [Hibiscus trionum]